MLVECLAVYNSTFRSSVQCSVWLFLHFLDVVHPGILLAFVNTIIIVIIVIIIIIIIHFPYFTAV